MMASSSATTTRVGAVAFLRSFVGESGWSLRPDDRRRARPAAGSLQCSGADRVDHRLRRSVNWSSSSSCSASRRAIDSTSEARDRAMAVEERSASRCSSSASGVSDTMARSRVSSVISAKWASCSSATRQVVAEGDQSPAHLLQSSLDEHRHGTSVGTRPSGRDPVCSSTRLTGWSNETLGRGGRILGHGRAVARASPTTPDARSGPRSAADDHPDGPPAGPPSWFVVAGDAAEVWSPGVLDIEDGDSSTCRRPPAARPAARRPHPPIRRRRSRHPVFVVPRHAPARAPQRGDGRPSSTRPAPATAGATATWPTWRN